MVTYINNQNEDNTMAMHINAIPHRCVSNISQMRIQICATTQAAVAAKPHL